ncbi:hypothetical protein RhiirA5_422143 [Rhizophagus irregularis]|uniref:Uncharacterized protein n=2 Tax=Rhizophagus irregularis TaxID=588596 RepID=A0A2N0PCG6_9GLOM|nr:hypothetical protein RhiirA5_422143 [Rhizophagus irregularis]GBC43893.1 hypothetical protein RIR_jg14991.t1 [Rhizophagus irregularis DAOM 181602=DAOM 197198]
MKKEFLLKKDLMFFQKLEDLNLWDVHKEEHDMDQTREICTFTGVSSMTRIDYIWRIVFNYQKSEDLDKEFFEKELIENALEWRDEWSIEEKWLFYKKKLDEKKNKYIKKEKNNN